MKTHNGKKSAQLQVLLESSDPTNIPCNENFILTIPMVTCAHFLHCQENTNWRETCPTIGAGRCYSLNKHDHHDKNTFTVPMVVCTPFLQCHVNTYRWETFTTMAALRIYLSIKHNCLWLWGHVPSSIIAIQLIDWVEFNVPWTC